MSLNHKRYQALIQQLESETDVIFVEVPDPSDDVCLQVLQMILLHFDGLQFTSLSIEASGYSTRTAHSRQTVPPKNICRSCL